ncbi:MAG: gamma-glutamyltransferase [Acidobacteria bacterium]|nr:gamma-glutamyltransferase [Acidobacteriota bacterium]
MTIARVRALRRFSVLTSVAAGALCLSVYAQAPAGGVQDPAWSPDGKRLATSFVDRIWISGAAGRGGRPLTSSPTGAQRDPAWSPDGRSLAYAAETGTGFDIVTAPVGRGRPRTLTSMPGDERWPSWTRDGRVVFSHRPDPLAPWRLYVVPAAGGEPLPLFADAGDDDEREARVSPDGRRLAYISSRDAKDDVDVWVAELPAEPNARGRRIRVTDTRGREGFPAWAPDGARLAYYAVRENAGSIWVTSVQAPGRDVPRERPLPAPVLVSRRGGVPAWSPDGRRIAIAELPPPDPAYNGNPLRNADEPPPLFAVDAFRLWTVDAPLPVDAGAREVSPGVIEPAQLLASFDRVWESLRRMYYSDGPGAAAWTAMREKLRPEARAARTETALEAVVDRLIADQPLINPAVMSNRAVVVSGHPLASEAGAMAMARGGNIVDAAIAASFALGVVEPEASGIGGDGMALLYLKGMREPIVVDYKDQVPIRATSDNPLLRQNTGDGPLAANIPGVVAGMDYLYQRYASRKVSWADLLAPAIRHAEQGFHLDEALPTTIAEGRSYFEKYPESRRIFLPGGRVPRPGDRFVNTDYGATLRTIARDGAQAFYRGDIARRIAADMARNGGLIGLDDLAQYRAIERQPLAGRYRDYTVFSTPPPVSTGLSLIETLQILQNFRPRGEARYLSDADYLHHAIESWKVRDPVGRIADPALWPVDLGEHLDEAHAAWLFKRIDPSRASRFRAPPPAMTTSAPPTERIGRGTTAFAVADADGNMIALTQTLSTWGGTFYVSEGLGFLYNNHLRFGGGGGQPGRFLPLARSSTTNVPTLLFRPEPGAEGPGVPVLAVGAAGNAWILASVYNIILNVLDGGMSAQQAIEAPRFLIGRDPSAPDAARIQIEDRFPIAVLDDLESRGHRFQKISRKGEVRYGYAAAVVVDTGRRMVEGGADPRRSHAARAVQ